MTTKLTLTIEEDVINAAKSYAHRKGRSLSNIIENYLKALSQKDKGEEELSPRVKKLLGAVKLPQNFDYKTAISEELAKKYIKHS